LGYQYGEYLQVIKYISQQSDKRHFVVLDIQKDDVEGRSIDTVAAAIDGLLQAIIVININRNKLTQDEIDNYIYIPSEIGNLQWRIYNNINRLTARLMPEEKADQVKEWVWNGILYNENEEIVAILERIKFRRVPRNFLEGRHAAADPSNDKLKQALGTHYYVPEWHHVKQTDESGDLLSLLILYDPEKQLANSIGVNVAKNIITIGDQSSQCKNDSNEQIIDFENETASESTIKEIIENNISTSEKGAIFYFIPEWDLNNISANASINKRVRDTFKPLLIITKALSKTHVARQLPLIIVSKNAAVVLPADNANAFISSGAMGFSVSAMTENPALVIKYVDIDSDTQISGHYINHLKNETLTAINAHANENKLAIAYRKNQRYMRKFHKQTLHSHGVKDAHSNSVMLIVGGLGGIGIEIIKRVVASDNIKIAIVGRSALNGQKQRVLNRLQNINPHVQYYVADVTNYTETNQVIGNVVEKWQKIDLVIHCGGVVDDRLLVSKNWRSFQKVLDPKLTGTWNVHRATQGLDLKYFVVFSSIVSIIGNRGQIDYATANALLDGFIQFRKKNNYPGKSIAINWSLWDGVGMGENLLAKNSFSQKNLEPINAEKAVNAFFDILESESSTQIAVSANDLTTYFDIDIKYELSSQHDIETTIHGDGTRHGDNKVVKRDQIEQQLIELFARKLGTNQNEITTDDSIFTLGIDSIVGVEIMDELEQMYEGLSPTLLYEQPNISALTEYLFDKTTDLHHDYQDEVRLHEVSSATRKEHIQEETKQSDSIPVEDKQSTEVTLNSDQSNEHYGIAVVGMSGRFPSANNLDEFWENLVSGKDCITQIPAERWDCDKYFDQDRFCKNSSYSKWGGFISGIDEFDSLFFNISPKDAEQMDPQQRLLLQCVWETMENAGYADKSRYNNSRIGVFVGNMWNEYSLISQERGLSNGIYTGPGTQQWAVANRISYYFDFTGPSISLDTACSSSLTAIDQACKSILFGDCEAAIACGVNISLHPAKYVYLSQSKFLSSEGKCRSFEEGADGYVPGEGVASILLKPLAQAKKDGDKIYGIIRGTEINHGGKATGFTVPNPRAQSEIIERCLHKAKVTPEDIQYVECHGTGTALGDPIEIQALTNVYEKSTDKRQYCTVGTVKENIGHLEGAAGIAGLIKVLLCMQHKVIPGSLNKKQVNNKIKFENTPFHLSHEPKDWIPEAASSRIAAVSSFGAGGSNAHIIVEAFDEAEKVLEKEVDDHNNIFVFSAKNQDRLKELLVRMQSHFENIVSRSNEYTKEELLSLFRNISYTLQIGRQAMEERLAIVAATFDELTALIKCYLNDELTNPNIYISNIRDNRSNPLSIIKGKPGKLFINETISEQDFHTLAILWVGGISIDWTLIHSNHRKTVPLPTYSFDKRKYWIAEPSASNGSLNEYQSRSRRTNVNFNGIEPLKHDGEGYQLTLTGNEFFLKDHKVREDMILPGVAYLEAVKKVVDNDNQYSVIRFEKINWLYPVIVNDESEEGKSLVIKINNKQDVTSFEVSSEDSEGQSTIVHSKGNVSLLRKPQQIVDILDIPRIESRCANTASKTVCYEIFSNMGLKYGPTFQVIDEIRYNEKEVIARVKLSEEAIQYKNRFVIHPSLMDGSLQTCVGLLMENKEKRPFVPFSARTITCYKELSENSIAYAKRKNGKSGSKHSLLIDVVLTDYDGNVLVNIDGLELRLLDINSKYQPKRKQKSLANNHHNVLCAKKVWRQEDIVKEVETGYSNKETAIFFGGVSENQLNELRTTTKLHNLNRFKTDNEIAENIESICAQLLETVKSFRHSQKQRILVVVEDGDSFVNYAPILGFLKTAQQELTFIQYKLVRLPAEYLHNNSKLFTVVSNELNVEWNSNHEVRYDNDQREVSYLVTTDINNGINKDITIDTNAVYWITGGMGGLGRLITKYISAVSPGAKVVLSGRSPLNRKGTELIAELQSNGTDVSYVQCNVCSIDEVKQLQNYVRDNVGEIKGIIHAAGIINDGLIVNKSLDKFMDVLAPKIAGTLNIDSVFAKQNLDFMILFSSISGVTGNIGQCDYASANTFIDEFAEYRQNLVSRNLRTGRTLAIDWPLWSDGGMRIDEYAIKHLEMRFGLSPMTTESGLNIFRKCLNYDTRQLVVLSGNIGNILSRLNISHNEIPNDSNELVHSHVETKTDLKKKALNINNEDQLKLTRSRLLRLFESILKVPASELDMQTDFRDYGIDSVAMMEIMNELEKAYNRPMELDTIINNSTIDDLSSYLTTHGLTAHENLTANQQEETDNDSSLSDERDHLKLDVYDDMDNNNFELDEDELKGKIAVIGMACRFPESETIEKFWTNLKSGNSCISEVSKERWDIDSYFDTTGSGSHTTYTKWAGLLNDVYEFDAAYFGISDPEALCMDPQQRICLELAEETFAQAGYKADELKGSDTGVFIGAKEGPYLNEHFTFLDQEQTSKMIVNNIANMIAARIADHYDFRGPSYVIDTACSSSLVSVHNACQSILNGECTTALAGGISLIMDEKYHVGFSQAKVLSRDNKSNVFDENASGFVLGEGAGLVFLKDYKSAIRDGDNIQAVILGSAVNNDGKTMGLTTPNKNGQKDVIQKAIKRSKINAELISYLETHGTGTLLGDPVEIKSAKEIFRDFTDKSNYCAVGSVKTNVGHLLLAAGIASLIKVILSLKHKMIPASLNCDNPHPRFGFESSPFYPITNTRDWFPIEGKRIAGISSFGFGGTNCHMIIAETPHKSSHSNNYNRQPLPTIDFNRKYYRLGRPIADKKHIDNDLVIYRDILDALTNNEITLDQAEEFIQEIRNYG
jgi:acyl transferase domain-containing protein/NAD(P)-dependent dehydrogenase (short-subunit alcohol dehydrogenase family)/acyl carrier protein